MGGSGRTSGEYEAPVTQAQFSGFVNEFHIYTSEARTWMATVNSQLSEGQSRMAVLQADAAEFRKRSDEASSKINLLALKEAVRAKQEEQEETVALPAVQAPPVPPPAKSSFADMLKDKFLSALAMVVVAVVMATGWTLLRDYVATHPNVPGEEAPAPAHHERGREPTAPASSPASTPAAPTHP